MGTNACIFIRGKFLCYTHYDSHPFKLGDALSHVRTNWKDILRVCKDYRILLIDAKFWVKDPKFVYDCFDEDWQKSYTDLLNQHLVDQFKNGNKDII